MTDEQLKNLILLKLKRYSLYQENWKELGRIKSLEWKRAHALIEYTEDFPLQDWIKNLKHCDYFQEFEFKYYDKIWRDEYPYSLRENELRWSLHFVHDGKVKAAFHLDSWNPAKNAIMHLICDVILNWS
jgi:hypothetical protein